MKNQVFASVLAGVLFGFSALLMWFKKEEPFSAILMATSALLMLIYAYQIRNKEINRMFT